VRATQVKRVICPRGHAGDGWPDQVRPWRRV